MYRYQKYNIENLILIQKIGYRYQKSNTDTKNLITILKIWYQYSIPIPIFNTNTNFKYHYLIPVAIFNTNTKNQYSIPIPVFNINTIIQYQYRLSLSFTWTSLKKRLKKHFQVGCIWNYCIWRITNRGCEVADNSKFCILRNSFGGANWTIAL